MLEFKRKVFEFKLDGTVHSVSKPNLRQVEQLQVMQEKKGEKVEVIVEFLSMLGLDKDVAYGMEAEHLEVIVESVVGKQKA